MAAYLTDVLNREQQLRLIYLNFHFRILRAYIYLLYDMACFGLLLGTDEVRLIGEHYQMIYIAVYVAEVQYW